MAWVAPSLNAASSSWADGRAESSLFDEPVPCGSTRCRLLTIKTADSACPLPIRQRVHAASQAAGIWIPQIFSLSSLGKVRPSVQRACAHAARRIQYRVHAKRGGTGRAGCAFYLVRGSTLYYLSTLQFVPRKNATTRRQ